MKIRVSICIVFLSCGIIGHHVAGLVTSMENRRQVRDDGDVYQAVQPINSIDDGVDSIEIEELDEVRRIRVGTLRNCICDYSTNCSDECYSSPRTCVFTSDEVGYMLDVPRSCDDTTYQTSTVLTSNISHAESNYCRLATSLPEVQAVEVEEKQLFSSDSCGKAGTFEQTLQNSDVDWPWHVALRFEDAEHVHCSGTLVGSRWVLTSAHCLDRYHNGELSKNVIAERLRVFVSNYDGKTLVGEPEAIFIPPSGVRSNDYNYENDVALIRLGEAVDAMPACLPAETFSLDELGDLECLSVAYDHSSPDGALCEELQKVTVFNTSNAYCNVQDPMNSRLCAGSQEKNGTCSSNSGGGGLFCKTRQSKTEQWMLLGLTRGGNGDATDCIGWLGYYERLSFYMKWIERVFALYLYV